MRAVGELVVLLAVVGFVVVLAAAVVARLRPPAPRGWRVDTRALPDGTLLVVVRRDPGDERVIRELPPGLEATELAAELRLAREDAELAVRELNGPPA